MKKFNNKLEKFNDKKKISAIILSLIMIVSIGLCMMYPKINEEYRSNFDNFNRNEKFYEKIYGSMYSSYFWTLGSKVDENTDEVEEVKYDILVKDKYKYYANFIEEFNNSLFPEWKEYLNDYMMGSYSINKVNDVHGGSGISGIVELLYNNEDKRFGKINFDFYVIMDFDKNGNLTITDIWGDTEENFKRNIKLASEKSRIPSHYLEPIKDATVAFGVPRGVYYKNSAIEQAINSESFIYISIPLVILILLAIFIPYKLLKKIIGFKIFKKLPFEINILLTVFILFLIIQAPSSIMLKTIEDTFVFSSYLSVSDETKNIFVYIANIAYWFMCFTYIFYEIIYIKYIFKEGVKRYFKQNIFLVKFFSTLNKGLGKLFKYARNIDLREKNNKKILTMVVINFIIIFMSFCIVVIGAYTFGGGGYLITLLTFLIYLVIMFIILKRSEKKIQSNYKILLRQTNEMSSGNLDFKVDEDLGIFNELKDELQKIQGGFKKAVDEEVKSQNMKTELISNVSHDLKTPLTSIISYVDLLKSEKDEEKKKQYIETLDKKSQRLKALIEDLFEMSKASSGNINLNIIEVNIISLIKQTMIELNDKIKDSTIKFKFSYSEEKIILPLDSQRTFRVFENLILNITKYSMKNSRAYIDVIKREDKVQITLRNISENELDFGEEEIVERFVRGDRSRNTEGSGLGLAIAKSFVELQGGTFNIRLDGDLFKVTITFKID
ncbi:sensor histidine kinase [Clostridium sardiniense]|uniref:histidine kinase n=1 Tax=Clostridium sardiniense TaxID=29369 RepID=A0ABS7KU40_CLOSR|nr:sensor histidine kinase [Clostridium sardiniense]MBY0754336.1 sensor histidine kinase [Clostridium sardiniense]MDQ0461068.1 signal transduction histidine kinase [Clostridium sardiniense]